MADSDDSTSGAGSSSQSDDSEPGTSLGSRRRAGLKRKLVPYDSEDDDDHPNIRPETDDESDEDEAGSSDSDSSNGAPGAETCAICLGRMRGEVGSPDSCEHVFCFICILEWAKTNATCPQDRKTFKVVHVREVFGGPIEREVPIEKQKAEVITFPEEEDNPTYCEVCNECDREERLLLCDGCDLGYHLECLDPPLTQVPVEEWFCPCCSHARLHTKGTSRQAESTADARTSSKSGLSRPHQSSQRSRQPRRIPRTRANERIRIRIEKQRKISRKFNRKRRRKNKKEKVASGELEDKRPAIKHLGKFSYFVQGDNDIDAEHTVDDFADQLLAGCSGQHSDQNQENRKANAAKLLRHAAFKPQATYSGKTPNAIIDRLNTHREEREDDVLSGILENQSITLSSSKKLTLTNDRKLTKQDGVKEDLNIVLDEGNAIMSEPLPSRKPSSQKTSETSESSSKEETGSCSSASSRSQHRPNLSDSQRDSPSNSGPRSRSPHDTDKASSRSTGRPQSEDEWRSPSRMLYRDKNPPQDSHQSPLEDKRRSPPRMSFQRQFVPQHNRREKKRSGSPNRKSSRDYSYDRWSDRRDQSKHQRRNSPHRRPGSWRDTGDDAPGSYRYSDEECATSEPSSHGGRSGNRGYFGRPNLESGYSREPSGKRNVSPGTRYDRHSHRERSPFRKNRMHEREGHIQHWNQQPSRGRGSYSRRDREEFSHRSYKSNRPRSRSRSRSRSRERFSHRGSSNERERKPRSQWGYSYYNAENDNEGVKNDTTSHSLHSVHHPGNASSINTLLPDVQHDLVDRSKNISDTEPVSIKETDCVEPHSSSAQTTQDPAAFQTNFFSTLSNLFTVRKDALDSSVPRKDQDSSVPSKYQDSSIPSNDQDSSVPSKDKDSSVPSKCQDSSIPSKENMNPSSDQCDLSNADKGSNWSQDNWNSIHCEDKKGPADVGNFKVKHIKTRMCKVLASLFGNDEENSSDEEELRQDTEKPEEEKVDNDDDGHIVEEEKDKKSRPKNRNRNSKNRSHTQHDDTTFTVDNKMPEVTPPFPVFSVKTKGSHSHGDAKRKEKKSRESNLSESVSSSHGKTKTKSHALFSDVFESIADVASTEPTDSDLRDIEMTQETELIDYDHKHDWNESAKTFAKFMKEYGDIGKLAQKHKQIQEEKRMQKTPEYDIINKETKDGNAENEKNTLDSFVQKNHEGERKDTDYVVAGVKPSASSKKKSKRDDSRKDDTKKNDIRKDDTRKDDTKKNDTRKDDTRKDDTKKNDIRKDGTRKDDTSKDDTRRNDTKKNDTKKDGTRKDDTSKDDARRDDTKKNDTKKDGTRKDDTSKDDTRKDGTKKNDTKRDGTKKDGTKKDDTRKDETRKDGTKKNDIKRDGTRKNDTNRVDTNGDDTRRNDTKGDDTKGKDSRRDGTKKVDTKEDDTKGDDTKKDDTRRNNTKRDDNRKDDTNGDDTKANDTKGDDTRKDDTSMRNKQKASLEAKVVEEVKKWLDPYYRDKSVTKEEYKQIVAKCVKKVVSKECGDIVESEKMRTLVEGYVVLYKHRRSKLLLGPNH
ncbi:uncharacterized protein LOC121880040 isoform X2 [Homarus americanus]|uniref:uncharacterized protein LOC121880040 isoform X2 n=1 Tax=Homarus americanus TaxID=6706 RepID=UPI001C47C40F|nr:uncharacterized protein LOC121880040 isoform X2 [Homarus americanus]